jgi:hypothetical protein
MKSVRATLLRRDLEGYAKGVEESGEPVLVTSYGENMTGLVSVESAQLLDQIRQFDTCGVGIDVMRDDLKRIFEGMTRELSGNSGKSLIEIIRKIVNQATTVQEYHVMLKSLGIKKH